MADSFHPSFAGLLAIAVVPMTAWVACAQTADPKSRSGTGGLFDEMPVVEAASLHTQTLQEAPANVTIVSDEDIRKYGYRTLGDALSGARGFYMNGDRGYQYVGLRGFLLPGDYNTRFLVMINGHPMTEIIFNSNLFFGQDFGLDMDLVKRIEIIRGPASALYGSNGILCTVNIVTKSPVEYPAARATSEVGSFGEKKVQLASSLDLGRGANLLLSVAAVDNAGQDLYYPEFASPEFNNGWARGVDGERAYHAFANLVWHNWSIVANLSGRGKHVPVVPWIATKFADPETKLQDSHDFVEARYSRDLGLSNTLQWRLYYDRYISDGRYDSEVDTERDYAEGDWAGSQITVRHQWRRFGASTAGFEMIGEARSLQTADIVFPEHRNILQIEQPDLRGSVFFQHEMDLTRRWKANVGVRYDQSRLFGADVSPRAALLFRQSPVTVYKFLWGHAFRNPSVYEAYYDDGGLSQQANPGLRPEYADTWEASWERLLKRRINLVATAYRYDLRGLIQGMPVGDGLIYRYENVSQYRTYGTEFEVNGHLGDRLEGAASFALQHARDLTSHATLPNSPAHVAKVRLAVPLRRNRFYVSTVWQHLSGRNTLAGNHLPGVPTGELHLSTFGLTPTFDLQFGVRNLLNRQYYDPAGGAMIIDRIRANGRSVYLKLIWHTR